MKSVYIFVNFLISLGIIVLIASLLSAVAIALFGHGALASVFYIAAMLTLFVSGAIFRIIGFVLIPVNMFLGFVFNLGRRQTA